MPITQRHLLAWDGQWKTAIAAILPSVHPVDREPLLVWLQMYPLAFAQLAQENSQDEAGFRQHFQVRGRFRLAEQADQSHTFLYSHRYWPAAKQALIDGSPAEGLEETIRAVAASIAAPAALTLPIAAVALMTLRQAGAAFLDTQYVPPATKQSADEALAVRQAGGARTLWQKVTGAGKLRIVMNERRRDGWFPLVAGQHITTAAELDKRPYHQADERCYEGMGPIPVDCRSGSCGTCWVGILQGRAECEPLSDFERKRLEYFGYAESEFWQFAETDRERPLVRLACQTVVRGSCSIVIPPWNGVYGAARRAAKQRKP